MKRDPLVAKIARLAEELEKLDRPALEKFAEEFVERARLAREKAQEQ